MKNTKNIFALGIAAILFAVAPLLVAGTQDEEEEYGSITGTVNVASTVSVIKDGETIESIPTDANTGEFLVDGLAAGTYSIEVYPEAEGYKPKMINDVVVDEGEATDLGEILLEVVEEE